MSPPYGKLASCAGSGRHSHLGTEEDEELPGAIAIPRFQVQCSVTLVGALVLQVNSMCIYCFAGTPSCKHMTTQAWPQDRSSAITQVRALSNLTINAHEVPTPQIIASGGRVGAKFRKNINKFKSLFKSSVVAGVWAEPESATALRSVVRLSHPAMAADH